ncbi:MAG TPA: class I SAM-dependent methyltransferase [Hyphomicrobiales bacterium]|nr:class I SAM-dependent methyltransferase [Hyphomicrobiales bacterium]
MPRTQEEFDKWFSEAGDPWHYDGAFVIDRLRNSLSFIQRYIAPGFEGAFVEIGAFNGAFSSLLAEAFPTSLIIANDISEVAIQQARQATAKHRNILFDRSDMASFRTPEAVHGRERVLLLMESLYYLHHEERADAIRHLLATVRPTMAFVSGPIQGDRYFTENELIKQFEINEFFCSGISVLNTSDEFRSLPQSQQDPKSLKKAAVRRKYGRQVMYRFCPGVWNGIRTRLAKAFGRW